MYIISGCQKLDEPFLMKHIDHENYITTFCTFSVNVERLKWPTGRKKQYGPLLKSRRFKKRDWICSPISSKKSRNSNYGCEFLFKQLSRANIAHYIKLFLCQSQRDFEPLIWICHLFGGGWIGSRRYAASTVGILPLLDVEEGFVVPFQIANYSLFKFFAKCRQQCRHQLL